MSTIDDPSHPIPSLDTLDVMTVKKDGGADLHIVIAQPLRDDPHSHTRILDKLQNYLGFIRSPEFSAQVRNPSIENTSVIIDLHTGSAPGVRDLLERCVGWVADYQARLEIRDLET